MRQFVILSVFCLLWNSLTFAGEGQWTTRVPFVDVVPGLSYSVAEPDWSNMDTRSATDFKGFVFLEYTRKNQSDLDGLNPWKVFIEIEYFNGGILETATLEINSLAGNSIYADYHEIPLSGINGYSITVKGVSGEYYDGSNWISVITPQYDANFPVDIDFRLELRCDVTYFMEYNSPLFAERVGINFDPLTYRVSWNYEEGAEWYDLEWVFIDFYSQEYALLSANLANPSYFASGGYTDPFEMKEPSRVRLRGTHYVLDEVFPKGQLFFRVRTVSQIIEMGNVIDQVVPSEWNYFTDADAFSTLNIGLANYSYAEITDVEKFAPQMNWLYGVAYAEDGKFVSSLTYYDGSNRGRQSLTYNTSDDITLIGESKYDREGRQTISVVPAPVAGRQLGYRSSFNLAIVGGSILPFEEAVYDVENYVGINGPQLASVNTVNPSQELGAGQYFSPDNQFTEDLFRAAIPDANGYVYSQTIFRNDGTGRVERVGGIGEEFQVGGNHAVRTYYGSPASTDLIRLFGSNVPSNLDGYRKEMVRDANGQHSVTYYDKRGNVIATALAGESPTSLIPLDDQNITWQTTNLLDNNIETDPYTLVSEHTFLNQVEGVTVTLDYDVTGVLNQLAAQSLSIDGQVLSFNEICESCKYIVTIEVIDQEGNQVQEVNSTYGMSMVAPFGPNTVPPFMQYIDPAEDCVNQTVTPNNPTYGISLQYLLPEVGEYRIIKKLEVVLDSMSFTPPDPQPFIDNYIARVDTSMCFGTCDLYCESAAIVTYEFENGAGTWDNLSQALKDQEIADCIAESCNPDELYEDFANDLEDGTGPFPDVNPFEVACETFRQRMLDQISPGGVFYENLNSQFWADVLTTEFNGDPNNQITINGNGYTLGQIQDPAQFIPEMAEALLDYHREACHLLTCDKWAETTNYSSGLMAIFMNMNNVWNIGNPLFSEPYNTDVTLGNTSWTEDPFNDDLWNLFNFVPPHTLNLPGNGNLEQAVDDYYTYLTDHGMPNTFAPACNLGPFSQNAPQLFNYVESMTLCIQQEDILQSLFYPASHYDEIRRFAFNGLYNQIKQELIKEYKEFTVPVIKEDQCIYQTDIHTVFIGPQNPDPMNNQVSGMVSGLLNYNDCETTAYNNVVTWLGAMPPTCLNELYLAGDYDPNFNQNALETNANPTNLEQLLYNYSMATCGSNTWGWFYDPDPNVVANSAVGGDVEYNDVIVLLNSVCTGAVSFIETTTPGTQGIGITNQQFTECFMAYLEMINDGLAQLNALLPVTGTTSCPGAPPTIIWCEGIELTVDGTSYPALNAAPCELQGVYTFSVQEDEFGGVTNSFGLGGTPPVTGCLFKMYVDIDPNGENPNSGAYIVSISNPTKVNYYTSLNGYFWNEDLVLFDVLYSNGNIGTAFLVVSEVPCLDFGDFTEQMVDNFDGLNLSVPDYTDDCIEMMLGQAQIDAQNLYNEMVNNVLNQFLQNAELCIDNAVEHFKLTYPLKEYQYTLYYYDLAGNLVQTVPPQGVDVLPPSNFPNGDWNLTEPIHRMETRYQYNGLNTLIAQYTPDGGHSDFVLDQLYRVRFSQNARQVVESRASYTRYDELGRVIEAGELQIPLNNGGYGSNLGYLQNYVEDNAFPATGGNRLDYTQTFYEEAYPNDYTNTILPSFEGGEQTNLRNAIGAIFHHQADYGVNGSPLLGSTVNTVISYSYDPHKNVKQVVNTNYQLTELGHQNKTVEYDYDLISGNVNEVIYQRNAEDEFRHAYHYDANNRLVRAFTSNDGGTNWVKEAKYFYYLHGSLARVELGEDEVQGIDYAYNLQGWLKGVNSSSLVRSRDIGQDAGSGDNSFFGMDAYGYNLGYFEGDYTPIGAITPFANTAAVTAQNQYLSNDMSSLYNGNITHMVTAMRDADEDRMDIHANNYRYDQLQRIKAMDVCIDAAGATAVTNNNFTGITVGQAYQTRYSFDKNGNLTNLSRRNDAGAMMDDFTYGYYETSSNLANNVGNPSESNRLASVSDVVTTNTVDIGSGQGIDNYRYDGSGQLIADDQEGIEEIIWTVTGKVKEIHFVPAPGRKNLKFIYDPMDMRVAKIEQSTNCQNRTITYYSYDAQGNVMATYTREQHAPSGGENGYGNEDFVDEFSLNEFMVYGASRLGVDQQNRMLTVADVQDNQVGGGSDFCSNAELLNWTNLQNFTYDQTMRSVGARMYELSEHRGNVLEVITDRKLAYNDNGTFVYTADVISYSDYYPYGSLMPGRHQTASDKYRYGFQGQEMDDEIKGEGNSLNYTFRMHDPRIGRFFARDPLADKYPDYSPYGFSGNHVINSVELEGLEDVHVYNKVGDGKSVYSHTYRDENLKQDVNRVDHYVSGDLQSVTYKDKKGNLLISYSKKSHASANQINARVDLLKVNQTSAEKIDTDVNLEFEALGKYGNTWGGGFKVGTVGAQIDLAYGVFESGYNSSTGSVNQYRIGASATIAFFGGSSSTIYVLPGDARVDNLKDEGVNMLIIEQYSFQFFGTGEASYVTKYHADLPENLGRSNASSYNKIGNKIVSAPRTQIGETEEHGMGYFSVGGSASVLIGGEMELKVTFEGGRESAHDGWATGYCFVAGTQITMSDGSIKKIEDVLVGDLVMTFNLLNNSIENQKVIEVISPIHEEFALIELSNGVSNKNTLDHPYYIKGKGWASYSPELTYSNYGIEVNKLEEGDICITYYGDIVREEKIIKISTFNEEQMTYNLSKVAKNNNFFANGILVHNKAMPDSE